MTEYILTFEVVKPLSKQNLWETNAVVANTKPSHTLNNLFGGLVIDCDEQCYRAACRACARLLLINILITVALL